MDNGIKKLYIIDGHAHIYSAYYAPMRPLTGPSGEPTKAALVFTVTLLMLFALTKIAFAREYPKSSIGFIEMPESVSSEWILKSPYGSEKAWGRPEMIRHLTLVCKEWNRRYPDGPKIRIGDISKPNGGVFPPHNTHQFGFSVDIKTRPQNIVDVDCKLQQQTLELAELFYTFGASQILYGYSHKFDGLPIIVPAEGHDTHFHVVINPSNVPDSGDWVIMPKIETTDSINNPQREIKDVLISCELIGVTKENCQWKTILPKELSCITFVLQDMSNPNNDMLTYNDLMLQSATVKKELILKTNNPYRWRIMINTPSQQKLQSQWFLLDNNMQRAMLKTLNLSDKPDIPVHFTILTCNPRASERITESYLKNEIKALNAEYIKIDPENKATFSFKSVCSVDTVKRSRTRLSRLIDTSRQYNKEQWRMFVNTCLDTEIVDNSAINVFIFDSYSKKNQFDSKSAWLQRNFNRPYIFLDWQRSLDYGLFNFIAEEPQTIVRYLAETPRLLRTVSE